MRSYYVKQLRNCRKLRSEIPAACGVYKWWCKKELLDNIIRNLNLPSNCINDIEMVDKKVIRECHENEVIESTVNENYYCIYVGDTSNLRSRILTQHLGGNVKGSTLRLTIAAVILGRGDENEINDIEDKMIIDVFHGEDLDCEYHDFQNREINRKFRLLNNDDIDANNELYSSERHYEVSKNGRSKKSSMITSLRNRL